MEMRYNVRCLCLAVNDASLFSPIWPWWAFGELPSMNSLFTATMACSTAFKSVERCSFALRFNRFLCDLEYGAPPIPNPNIYASDTDAVNHSSRNLYFVWKHRVACEVFVSSSWLHHYVMASFGVVLVGIFPSSWLMKGYIGKLTIYQSRSG